MLNENKEHTYSARDRPIVLLLTKKAKLGAFCPLLFFTGASTFGKKGVFASAARIGWRASRVMRMDLRAKTNANDEGACNLAHLL